MTNLFLRAPQLALAIALCAPSLSCAGRQGSPPTTTTAPAPAPALSPAPASGTVPTRGRPELADPGQQFVMVVAGMVEVIAGHGDDCDQTLSAATSWIEAHRPELVAIEQRLRVKVMAMAQEQRERYSDQLEELLKELVGDIDEAMNRFEAQCPEHAQRFGAQLDFLDIDYL